MRHTLAILIGFSLAEPCLAFSEAGHQITGFIAWQQMNADTRTKVLNILKEHKLFDDHFTDEMPESVAGGSEAEQNRWLFTQAAIFPDIARGFSGDDRAEFHRPIWHYINLPHFLSNEQKEAFGDDIPANLELEYDEADDADTQEKYNIVQAIKLCVAVLKDDIDDEEKAKYLCWLFHLVGDLHQPMHTTALFTTERFPKGDRGGNETEITPGSNLHSFWDSRLGGSGLLPSTIGTRSVVAMTEFEAEAEKAALCLDVEHWLQESHKLAVQVAYSESIMVGVAEQEDSDPFEPIPINDEYKTTAGSVSQQRAAEAGFRLARLLEHVLAD